MQSQLIHAVKNPSNHSTTQFRFKPLTKEGKSVQFEYFVDGTQVLNLHSGVPVAAGLMFYLSPIRNISVLCMIFNFSQIL